MNTSYDPNTIITEKLAVENIKENCENNESIDMPKRNRLLFSTVYKRHNQSSKSKIANEFDKALSKEIIKENLISQSIAENEGRKGKIKRRSKNNSKIIKGDCILNLSHYKNKGSSQTPTQKFFNQHVYQKEMADDQFQSSIKSKTKNSDKNVNEKLKNIRSKPINLLLSDVIKNGVDFCISEIKVIPEHVPRKLNESKIKY